MRLKGLSIIIVVGIIVLSLGCTSVKTNGAAMDAANATADRILNSLNTGNYTEFSTNFDPALLPVVNQSKFNEISSRIQPSYGKYVSRSPVPTTSSVQGFNIYLYTGYFERGNLTLKLVMNATNVSKVDGILFR